MPATEIGATIRCECGGEMYPVDDRGEHDAGQTVECDHCGAKGGVNLDSYAVFGAVEGLEIHGE